MNRPWERRDILRMLAAGSAYPVLGASAQALAQGAPEAPTLILRNGRFTTLDTARPNASAVAIADGRFAAVGDEKEIMKLAGPSTQVIDLGGLETATGPELLMQLWLDVVVARGGFDAGPFNFAING